MIGENQSSQYRGDNITAGNIDGVGIAVGTGASVTDMHHLITHSVSNQLDFAKKGSYHV